MRHPSVALAAAFLVAAFLATAAPAAERKAGDAGKSGSANKSTGQLIADEARHAGATAFSASKRDKCDDDRDNDRRGRFAQDRAKHPRPDDCDDDDDDGDDCDGHHGGHHKDKHKDKDKHKCHKSPKK